MSKVVTYYLEMKSPDSLNEKEKPEGFEIIEAEIKQYQLNRFLYQLVGEDWEWNDKLALSNEEWKEYSERENLRTWVAYSQGSIAGYYELEKSDGGNIEIAYFGLSPKFIAKGFGGYLLSQAIKSAWAWEGAVRIWVHTCSLDHKSALRNYQSRGFQIYREITNNK